jgi:hypothetical protein
MRSPLATLAAAALLGACSYEYNNLAEELGAGEVTGRALADLSGTGSLAPASGVTVTVRNSTNVQSSRENGRFFLLGMVPGRHTLLLEKDGAWALQRDIEIGFDSVGQPESVLLGDLQLRHAVTIGGTFSAPGYMDTTQPFAPTAFVIDEATGARAAATAELDAWGYYTGRFSYSFPAAPVGPHRLRYAIAAYSFGWPTTWIGGPLTQDIPETSEGQSLTLAPPVLHASAIAAVGKLHLRVSTPTGVAMPAVVVATSSMGTSVAGVPAPDSTGVFEMDLDEGIYFVRLDLGAAAGGTLEVPAELQVVVVADQMTDLGTLYVVDYNATSKGDYACLGDGDCFEMYTCQDRVCTYGAPAGPPLCMTATSDTSTCVGGEIYNFCTQPTGGTPIQCGSGSGLCGRAPDLTYVCVPVGYPDCRYGAELVPAPYCL